MRPASKSLFVFAAWFTLSAHIIGEEDRRYLHETDSEFFGVGRIYCQALDDPNVRTFSTATLVDNSETLLASGHYRSSGRENHIFAMSECVFQLHNPKGQLVATKLIRAEKLARPPEEYLENKAGKPDWAVLRLAAPVDPGVALPLEIEAPSLWAVEDYDKSFLVAYNLPENSGFRATRATVAYNCSPRIDQVFFSFFRHSCDADTGSSGGLIFRRGDASRSWVAFAMNTSESLPGQPIANHGQIISQSTIDTIRNRNW